MSINCRRARLAGCVRSRSGVAAVEFAIVAPVFILLVLGMIEIGRGIMVQQILTNASREGARRAIIEQSSAQEVKDLVNAYLAANSVNKNASVQVSPANIGPSIGFGDPITVSVSIPYSSVSWLPAAKWLSNITLSASSIMRAERPQ